MLSNYQIFYIVTEIFDVYVTYRILHIFYDQYRTSKKIEVLTLLGYYSMLIGIYLTRNIPLFLMASNLIALFLLSFNYHASFKKRILSSVYILFIFVGIELLAMPIFGFFQVSFTDYNTVQSTVALIVTKILKLMAVLIIGNFKNLKRGNNISKGNWMAVVFIPLMTIYIIIIIMNQSPAALSNEIILSIGGLLAINALVFYLYDSMLYDSDRELEKKLLIQQNRYYQHQFDLFRSSEKAVNEIKHDLKNQMTMLDEFINREEFEKAKKLLSDTIVSNKITHSYIYTGNVDFDSILNFKIREANQKNIVFNVNGLIPPKMNFTSYDLTTLLGNLIDNAIEAVENSPNNEVIDMSIRYSKKRLIIEMKNSLYNEVKFNDAHLPHTTKKDSIAHGIGYQQINKIVEKYEGELKISIDQNMFVVFIMLFVDRIE